MIETVRNSLGASDKRKNDVLPVIRLTPNFLEMCVIKFDSSQVTSKQNFFQFRSYIKITKRGANLPPRRCDTNRVKPREFLILYPYAIRKSVDLLFCINWIYGQGWQYGTVRSEFAYYVPCTLNCTILVYRTSVQFLKRAVPTYHTRTITKKAYRTSVSYFLAKIEPYCTVLYRTAILSSLNYLQL